MGEDVAKHEFMRENRTRYRTKVRRCLDVFARMLREASGVDGPSHALVDPRPQRVAQAKQGAQLPVVR